jgi:hypothetical protein
MTPIKLRDSLLLLLPQIGTYLYAGGATTAAIAIDQPGNDMTVTGIEVVIPSYPRIICTVRTTNLYHQDQEWDVVFYNHDLTDAGYEAFYLAVDVMYHSWSHITGNPIHQSGLPDSLPGYKFCIQTFACGDTKNPYNGDAARANYI